MKDPLLDKDFLLKLDKDRNREIYIKIISLNFKEESIEEINGRVQSGSINIDGSSSVRRTCSLTIVANELDIHQYYWGLKTKFKCFIGISNNIDQQYPDVIYFPMGTYLITSFNTSQNLNSYTISIQGKDKMALLNGDLGGTITAISVDFGQLTEQNIDGSITKKKLLLKDIIRNIVIEYAHEPEQNIVINDLDEAALELMEYRGKDPLYLIRSNASDEITNQTMNGETKYYVINKKVQSTPFQIQLSDLDDKNYFLDHRINLNFENTTDLITHLYATETDAIAAMQDPNYMNYYTVCKAECGEAIGYRVTDLTYAGDLIGQIGSNVTSIFDNIKNMLGDYEYFYNLEGQFIWQRKPTYINVSWNNLVQNDGDLIHGESAAYTSSITYSFENHNMVNSFSNNPNILNIKNDFSVFGQKTLAGGTQIPVHLRYAIDKKPVMYRTYDGVLYATGDVPEEDLRVIDIQPRSEEEILEMMGQVFNKTPNPPGLSEDWWDVWEWGEYYKFLTGEYPHGRMSEYATQGTKIDLNSIFISDQPLPVNIPGITRGSWGNPDRICFLFDTLTVDDQTYLCYTGHNPVGNWTVQNSCNHLYDTYFMTKYKTAEEYGCEFHAYFYKPRIPIAVIDDIIREEFSVKIRETPIIVDWRELIYRMASDYMKHGTTDQNNYELVKSTNFTQEDIDKGIYYIKKDIFKRATEYLENQVYYIKTTNNTYEITDAVTSETNFALDAYYIKSENSNYELATTYDANKEYYVYVDFYYRLRTYNDKYFPDGITGYEQYYTDMMSFWRDLYNPDYIGTYNVAGINKTKYYENGSQYYWFKNQEGLSYNPKAIYYTQDLYGNWRAHKQVSETDFHNYSKYYFLPVQGQDNITDEIGLSEDYIFHSNRTYYTFTDDEYYFKYDDKYINDQIDQLEIQRSKLEAQNFLKNQEFKEEKDYAIRQAISEVQSDNEEFLTIYQNILTLETNYADQINSLKIQFNNIISSDYYDNQNSLPEEAQQLWDQITNLTDNYYTTYDQYIEQLELIIDTSDPLFLIINNLNEEYQEKVSKANQEYQQQVEVINDKIDTLLNNSNTIEHPYAYWNKEIFTNPEDLDFWFDFLDTDGDLGKYSVDRIGDRPKTENNTNIKAVYYREIPNVIFTNNNEEKAEIKKTKTGYTVVTLNNTVDHLFKISSQHQSCKDKLNNLLYQYTVAEESITINAIPVYYLQPNTRIYVTDEISGINGEYIVSKIGFQLSHNGMMNISATKSIDRIY